MNEREMSEEIDHHLAAKLAERSEFARGCTLQYAEDMGYDCGKNGANTTNCHFGLFATRELTGAWERGKARASAV